MPVIFFINCAIQLSASQCLSGKSLGTQNKIQLLNICQYLAVLSFNFCFSDNLKNNERTNNTIKGSCQKLWRCQLAALLIVQMKLLTFACINDLRKAMRRLENKVFLWWKEKGGIKWLRTSTEICWWVGKYLTDPEPTTNSTLGVRLALVSCFNPSVLRSDRKQWQCNWQVLIAWFVLDQYQRYEQLRSVYAESLESESIMVFPPGLWGNSVRVALLGGPWLGAGKVGCTTQKGCQ